MYCSLVFRRAGPVEPVVLMLLLLNHSYASNNDHGLINAATIIVPLGNSSAIMQAIAQASQGDTIQLLPGVYNELSTIEIDKEIYIVGAAQNATFVRFSSALTPTAFLFRDLGAHMSDFTIVNVDTNNSLCHIVTPYALKANFTLSINKPPTIQNNMIRFVVDLGPWYGTRRITKIFLGDCNYATDAGVSFFGAYLAFNPDSCHCILGFDVKFSRLNNCGVQIVKEDTFVRYSALMNVELQEYVSHINSTAMLRIPITRTGNAITNVRIEIDRKASVVATIDVNYIAADLQALITKFILIGEGRNTSLIELNISLPAPYTIPTNTNGTLLIYTNTLKDQNLTATLWFVSPECNNVALGDQCNQTIFLNMTACDFTGQFQMTNVTVICQASTSPDMCPLTTGGADIKFFLQTINHCEENLLDIDNSFIPEIVLRENSLYNTVKAEDTFQLGETSYWSIILWTNQTGIKISDAVVTQLKRTSDGNCFLTSDYITYMNNISELHQMFFPNHYSGEIRFYIPVTVAMACSEVGQNHNTIGFNFTILVNYIDSSEDRRRRRRRRVFAYLETFPYDTRWIEEYTGKQYNRRSVDETTISKQNIGINAVPVAPISAEPVIIFISRRTEYIIIGLSLTVFVCCGCSFCCIIFFYMKQTENDTMKKQQPHTMFFKSQNPLLLLNSKTSLCGSSGLNMSELPCDSNFGHDSNFNFEFIDYSADQQENQRSSIVNQTLHDTIKVRNMIVENMNINKSNYINIINGYRDRENEINVMEHKKAAYINSPSTILMEEPVNVINAIECGGINDIHKNKNKVRPPSSHKNISNLVVMNGCPDMGQANYHFIDNGTATRLDLAYSNPLYDAIPNDSTCMYRSHEFLSTLNKPALDSISNSIKDPVDIIIRKFPYTKD